MVMAFDFFEKKKLRFRTLWPEGIRPSAALPDTTETAELEVALHCTGQDRGGSSWTPL
jgi:hypothetical protein